MRMDAKDYELPIGALHFGTRARKAMRRAGIATVGAFADHSVLELAQMQTAGAITSTEIRETAGALSRCISKDGEIDWLRYARLRGFRVLPVQSFTTWSGRKFARHFPRAASIAVENRFGRAGVLVLNERLLKAPNARLTMDQVGQKLGVIWETVRKLEIDIVLMFRAALLSCDYSGCRFRFRSEFVEPLRLLNVVFAENRKHIHSTGDCEEIFKRVWDLTFAGLGGQENILMDILGFRLLLRKGLPHATRREGTGVMEMRVFHKEIRRTLMRPESARISLKTLVKSMKVKYGSGAPSSEEVRALVRKMPRGRARSIVRGPDVKRPTVDWITNACERLLRRRGKPLHFPTSALVSITLAAPVPLCPQRSFPSIFITIHVSCRLERRAYGSWWSGRTLRSAVLRMSRKTF